MFLGFVKHGISNRSHSKLITTVISLSIISTVVIMFLMIDSFFLQLPHARSVMSPLQNQNVQNCVMSYSYPTFYEIASPESRLAQKYKLYLYREGNLDRPDHLYGTPVLFIPGQAGSYKQVRSLASATTHFAHDQHSSKNMDFFTVDLNEELSALSGQTLLDQAEYINSVTKRILSLYDSDKPTSVIIVGHSMGGIVARIMFMLPNYVSNSVDTIVTLATPHMTAPLLLDPIVSTVYNNMTGFWKSNRDALKNVTIISIAGGSLDNIIHSDSVNVESIIPETHGFTTYTSSIPGVWTSTDHMAILWCNQLIRLLAETLHSYLNLGDSPTVEKRMELFRFHLIQGKDSSLFEKQGLQPIRFQNNRFIDLDQHRSYNVFLNDEAKQEIIFISSSPDVQFLTNIDPAFDRCWSFVLCSKIHSYDIQFSCEYTQPNVTVLPSATASNLVDNTPYRLLRISGVSKIGYRQFRDESNERYIGLAQQCQINSHGDQPFIQAYMTASQPVHHANSVWDIIRNGLQFKVDPYHSHHLFAAVRNSLFAFDIRVTSIEENQSAQYKPMLEQRINNKAINYYRGLETHTSNRLTFYQNKYIQQQQGLSLRFFTDNQTLQIQIKFDWFGTLGRCVLRYGAIVANYLWICTLVVSLTQLYSYGVSGKREFPEYPAAFVGCVRSSFLQLAVILLGMTAFQHASSNPYTLQYALFGSDDWLFVGLLLLSLGVSVGLTAMVWLLMQILISSVSRCFTVLLKPREASHSINRDTAKSRFLLYSASTLGLIRVVPLSALFLFYFVVWFLLTCSAYTKSDLPAAQNVYRYRQSILIFLISFLPYHVPQFIVYVKDALIGWTYHPSYSTIMLLQDLPILVVFIYLITFGKNPDIVELKSMKYLIYVMNALILYQLIFGFLNPFILSFIVNKFN